VTVTNSETFAVTIEWLPGYSGCTDCQQTYKIRCDNYGATSFRLTYFCLMSFCLNVILPKMSKHRFT
jgi:hypothetical protein